MAKKNVMLSEVEASLPLANQPDSNDNRSIAQGLNPGLVNRHNEAVEMLRLRGR